jgi:hypothetical protein
MAIAIVFAHRNFLAKVRLNQADSTLLLEETTACIEWAKPVLGGREHAQHMDIRKRCEAVWNGHMRLYQILTQCQLS